MLILVRPAVNRVISYIIDAHYHVHSFLSFTQKASLMDTEKTWWAAEMNHGLNRKLTGGRYCPLRGFDGALFPGLTEQLPLWKWKRPQFCL